MAKSKTRMTIVVYTLLAVIGLICLWILVRTKSVEANVFLVKKGPFQETLLIDGVVRSQTKITVTAFATGDIGQVDLKVGDPVSKNQKITFLKWDYVKDVASPIDGVISKVYRDSAGPINRGDPIVEIIDPNNLEVVVDVLTTDAVRIPEGTFATINGLGLKEPLSGQVRRISRAGFVKLSALGIEEEKTNVYLKFLDPPPSSIGDNFHVEVRFVLSQDDQVLTIPTGALFKNKNSWAVYKVEKNRAHLQDVVVGKKSDTQAVILEGLSEGDLVILFPTDLIGEGKKVKSKISE